MVGFYLTWFFRLYQQNETGWVCVRTPDDGAIIHQDAYFWQSLEIIGRKFNEILANERWKAAHG